MGVAFRGKNFDQPTSRIAIFFGWRSFKERNSRQSVLVILDYLSLLHGAKEFHNLEVLPFLLRRDMFQFESRFAGAQARECFHVIQSKNVCSEVVPFNSNTN